MGGVFGEREPDRETDSERATLSEGDIPVAGCGFIVKVSELQSNKSHHLTPPSLTACSLPAARPSPPPPPLPPSDCLLEARGQNLTSDAPISLQ